MAIIFSKTFQNTLLWSIINTLNGGTITITLYGGTQPSADTVENNWASYNSTWLCHSTGITITQPNANSLIDYPQKIEIADSGTNTAVGTGTATWCIIWGASGSQLPQTSLTSGTIPNFTFLVADVSDTSGIGVVKLLSTSIVAGNNYSIVDFQINAAGGI